MENYKLVSLPCDLYINEKGGVECKTRDNQENCLCEKCKGQGLYHAHVRCTVDVYRFEKGNMVVKYTE